MELGFYNKRIADTFTVVNIFSVLARKFTFMQMRRFHALYAGNICSKTGSFDICPVCGWLDDGLMEDEPDRWGAAQMTCV